MPLGRRLWRPTWLHGRAPWLAGLSFRLFLPWWFFLPTISSSGHAAIAEARFTHTACAHEDHAEAAAPSREVAARTRNPRSVAPTAPRASERAASSRAKSGVRSARGRRLSMEAASAPTPTASSLVQRPVVVDFAQTPVDQVLFACSAALVVTPRVWAQGARDAAAGNQVRASSSQPHRVRAS